MPGDQSRRHHGRSATIRVADRRELSYNQQLMPQVYALKYLAKAAASAPRDLVNSYIARYKAIHPTVVIFHCTFVCDARCEMCSNWKRGDRKSDMTLAQIGRVFDSPLWKNVENANVSGGEPTTRNDLVNICELMLDRLPRLRKFGINTTGMTPHRAIPMLTKIVEMCHERGVIFSTRVSIDGIGEMHNDVRQVKRGFEKAGRTIRAMRELQDKYTFNFGISTTIFQKNLDDAENILAWAKKEQLDIVFNMVRFTDPMLGNADLADTCKPVGADEERMRQFFLDRVRTDSLFDGQNYVYMHYADMIANGYHRLAPCPFQTQGIMLNPNGDLFFCENSEVVGNVLQEDAEDIYFRAASQQHRDFIKNEKCPTCLSPCQMNVAAVKQVVPYVQFIVKASKEKRRSRSHLVTAPQPHSS
jgi:MoaA/NifB/PqqE/SkfB family radical SAM enzyme